MFLQLGSQFHIFFVVNKLEQIHQHGQLSVRLGVYRKDGQRVVLQEKDITGQGFLGVNPNNLERNRDERIIFSCGYLRRTDTM